MNNLIAIDIETSGTNPFIHDVLAVGLAPINSAIPNLELFIYQENLKWSDYARKNFEKFSKEWQTKCISPKEAIEQIEKYTHQHFNKEILTAVSHNVGFDVAFLRKLAYQADLIELPFLSHRAIDTHTLLMVANKKRKIDHLKNLTSDIAFEKFGITTNGESRHTALADAISTRELYLKLIKEISSH